MTGENLELMIEANEKYVSFINGTYRAALPVSYLEQIDIKPNDKFDISFTELDENNLMMTFFKNGEKLWMNSSNIAKNQLPDISKINVRANKLNDQKNLIGPHNIKANNNIDNSIIFDTKRTNKYAPPIPGFYFTDFNTKDITKYTDNIHPEKLTILISISVICIWVSFVVMQKSR